MQIVAGVSGGAAGRYVAKQHRGSHLLGSSNQKIHLLTPHYSIEDVLATPECEVVIDRAGNLAMTGVDLAPPSNVG